MEISKNTSLCLYADRMIYPQNVSIHAFEWYINKKYPQKYVPIITSHGLRKYTKLKDTVIFTINKKFAYKNTIYYLDFFEQESNKNINNDFTPEELFVLRNMMLSNQSDIIALVKNIVSTMAIEYLVYFILCGIYDSNAKYVSEHICLANELIIEKYNNIKYEHILAKYDYLSKLQQYRKFIEELYPQKMGIVKKALIRTGNYYDSFIPCERWV